MSLLSLVRMRPISICSWSFCLAWLTLCGVANAATLTIAWNRNPEPDIAGYVVHWGTQSGVYTSSSNVGNVTTQQVTGLADGTVYYFVVKAYNTAGLMSGYSSEVSGQSGYSSEVSGQTSGGEPPVDYTNTPADPAGVIGADFNGDSRPDLIWQNASTWQVMVWYMGGPQGNSRLGWNSLASTDVAGWSVVGAGDFNGDGKPDLVWQNDGTWEVVVWYMGGPQGNSRLGSNGLASTDVAGWRAIAR